MSNVDQAISLLNQAIRLLGATPTTAASAAPAHTGPSHELKFGKHKGKTLVQLFNAGELQYLGWVADKFGIDKDTGAEDPKWAKKNAEIRAEARALLNGGAPAAAPAPSYEAPAAPQQPEFEDDIPF